MLKKFYPGEYKESSYVIDYESLYAKGYRGLLFDIDNTLVPHGAPADGRAKALFKKLKAIGFQICLISNNKEERVKSFQAEIGVPYIYDAHKPASRGYLAAMEKMGTNKENTVFIGDQVFTDVYGANRIGLAAVLVKPIHPKEEIQIVFKRFLEKIVLFFYKRSRYARKGI